MDVYMPHSARVAIGQLRVPSHTLEIEAGRVAHIPREHRICRICRAKVEREEHYVCNYRAYHGIRSHYTALFSGQPTLRELMESRDQRQLGRFLLEIQRHRDMMLQSPSGDRQSHIPREHRICRICRAKVESEEHYVCNCRAYHGIRSHYTALFSRQPTLRELMESRDQRQLGRFLLEIQRHRDMMLQSPSGDRQSQLTDFFLRATPAPLVPTRQRGVTLQQADVVELGDDLELWDTGPDEHTREIHQIRAHHE
ncbi:hypothetical protein L7F22_035220 [Adiantum nelumboides]|nr:hypothetical protein [Adiantum nelumboides]